MAKQAKAVKSTLTHRQLVLAAYRWVLGSAGCGAAFRELVAATCNNEYPDVIGFSAWKGSVLVECKTSRSDFHADRKKPFRLNPEMGMGNHRFYCCPTGLLKREDLPPRWGLIYVNERGQCRTAYNPYNERGGNIWQGGFNANTQAEQMLMYSALRRLHLRGLIETIYEQPTT